MIKTTAILLEFSSLLHVFLAQNQSEVLDEVLMEEGAVKSSSISNLIDLDLN